MRDRLSKERRSWNMSRIRGKDTTPEKRVRSLVHRLGYRFRLHVRIPIPANTGERPKAVGHKKAQSAQKTSLSSSNEERVRVRSRKPAAQLSSTNHQPSISAPPSNSSPPRRGQGGFVRPDIVLPKHKTVIFVHGCFWHRHRGCKNCTTPTHRRAWWVKKLEGNAARDKVHQRALRKLG